MRPFFFISSLVSGAILALTNAPAMAQTVPENLKVSDVKANYQPVELFEDDGTTRVHRFSRMQCPAKIRQFNRSQTKPFSPFGNDVGCGYDPADKSARMSVYMSARGPAVTPDIAMAEALNGIKQSNAQKGITLSAARTNTISMNFGAGKLDCKAAEYDLNAPSSYNKTRATVCVKEGWVYKIRASWNGSDKSITKAEKALAKAQGPMLSHLTSCAAMAKAIVESKPSDAKGMSIHAEGIEYNRKGAPCLLRTTPAKDKQHVIVMNAWPDNADTPMTFDFYTDTGMTSPKPKYRLQDMWASVEASERGEAGYLLIKEDADGLMQIFTAYTKIPPSTRLIQDILKAENGEMKASKRLKRNAAGGFDIML